VLWWSRCRGWRRASAAHNEQWEAHQRRQHHSKERSSDGTDKHGGGKEGTDIDNELMLL
jgi:hypothetical protein